MQKHYYFFLFESIFRNINKDIIRLIKVIQSFIFISWPRIDLWSNKDVILYFDLKTIWCVNRHDTRNFLTGRRKICPTFGEEKGRREYRAKLILKGRQGENGKNNISHRKTKRGKVGGRIFLLLFHLIFTLSILPTNYC